MLISMFFTSTDRALFVVGFILTRLSGLLKNRGHLLLPLGSQIETLEFSRMDANCPS